IIPLWDHTGVSHFHSSTTSGSACLIKARRRESISPRQSASSWILASISRDAGSGDADSPLSEVLFFMRNVRLSAEILFLDLPAAFSCQFLYSHEKESRLYEIISCEESCISGLLPSFFSHTFLPYWNTFKQLLFTAVIRQRFSDCLNDMESE